MAFRARPVSVEANSGYGGVNATEVDGSRGTPLAEAGRASTPVTRNVLLH
jgi:hypothetical protein